MKSGKTMCLCPGYEGGKPRSRVETSTPRRLKMSQDRTAKTIQAVRGFPVQTFLQREDLGLSPLSQQHPGVLSLGCPWVVPVHPWAVTPKSRLQLKKVALNPKKSPLTQKSRP